MRCCSGNNRPRAARRVSARAFTLLEALIAILIAAAGFAGIFTALAQSQKVQIQSQRADADLALARTLIEDACLGLLPLELRVVAGDGGVDRWQGVSDGRVWTVTMRSLPVRPGEVDAQSARAAERRRPTDDAEGGAFILMDIVTCEVGGVTLTTVKW